MDIDILNSQISEILDGLRRGISKIEKVVRRRDKTKIPQRLIFIDLPSLNLARYFLEQALKTSNNMDREYFLRYSQYWIRDFYANSHFVPAYCKDLIEGINDALCALINEIGS